MTSHADSAAHFAARARECSVSEQMLSRLQTAGILTMSHLAFAICRPGQEFDEARFDTWLTTVNLGTAPSLGEVASVRRLHFEAEITLTQSLKAAVEQPASESTVPKSIPFAERSARLEQLRQQFPGMSTEGIHQPAHALLDECAHQYETRTIRYIEPSKCNSRETEVANGRSSRKLHIESSTLSVKETKNVPEEDVSTSMKLMQCLRRRAIAYEFANLISIGAHDKYIDKLLRRLQQEPPPSYQATTMSQLLRADKEVWIYLSQNAQDIRPRADGSRPLDNLLDAALQDYNVAFHLLPLPLPAQQQGSSYAPFRPRDQEYESKGNAKGKGKQRRKGKQGSKTSFGSSYAPKNIPGAVGKDNRGRPLCFDFNLATCTLAPAGGQCHKGRHVCFKANCFKPHAFSVAHASEMPTSAPAA